MATDQTTREVWADQRGGSHWSGANHRCDCAAPFSARCGSRVERVECCWGHVVFFTHIHEYSFRGVARESDPRGPLE